MFYRYAFLLTLPAVLVYLIAYFIVIKAPKPDDTAHKSQPSIQKLSDEEEKPLLQDTDIGREFFYVLKLSKGMGFVICKNF